MKAAMIATRSAGYARTKARAIKQDTLRSFTKLFSSSAATGKKPDEETNIQSQLRSLYFWGTPNKGTIPTAEALESGRGNGETGGSLVNLERFTGSSVIDYPTEIDSQDAFGIGEPLSSKYEQYSLQQFYAYLVHLLLHGVKTIIPLLLSYKKRLRKSGYS